MKRHFLSASTLSAALAFATAAPSARAATFNNGNQSAKFDVSLTLQAGCSVTASPLNFGSQSALTAPVKAQTSLLVTCTNTTQYNIGLDAGTITGSSTSSRLLAGTATGNTSTLGFALYQDPALTTNWGNTQGNDTEGGTGSGSAQTINVYGQIPVPTTTPQPDTYKTTITATVYF